MMRKYAVRVMALGLAILMIAAAGCRKETVQITSHPEEDNAAEASAPTESAMPERSTPLVSWTEGYTAPSPMTPPDGRRDEEGHTLWPVWDTLEVNAYDGPKHKYGFINEKGEKVLPNEYVLYHYDVDQEGRCYLFAGQGSYTDIYTLAGEKVLQLPGESAEILSGTDWILVKMEIPEFSLVKDTHARQYLYDLKTGKNLLKEDYAYIQMLRKDLFLTMDSQGREYLLVWNNDTYQRTLLEGYTTWEVGSLIVQTGEELLLPAASSPLDPYEDNEDALFGYLNMDGTWAIAPQYREVTPFIDQYAAVETEAGEWRFIDRQGRFAGEKTYTHIYYSFDGDGYSFSIYYEGREYDIDENLHEKDKPQDNGWVNGVYYYKGQKLNGLPAGCDSVDYIQWPIVVAGSPAMAYWMNMETGERETLSGGYRMIGEFSGMYVFQKQKETVVLDADGQRLNDTVFHRYPAAVEYLEALQHDSRLNTDGRYLWVTTAQYQGYIDVTGKWMYRESRYGVLED